MTQSLKYYLPDLSSPIKYNLSNAMQSEGMRVAQNKNEAQFSEDNLTLDEYAARNLEYKHLLAEQLSQHCPEVMPLTYGINDKNYADVIHLIANNHYVKNGKTVDQVNDLVWIYKPSMQNNGENIKIFSRLSQLVDHYSTSNRLGGDHVVQQYITHPHLLNGHKYTFRMYVVVTNYVGAYLYRDGYFNIGMQAYTTEDDFHDLSLHLTNEHLFQDKENVMQVPTLRCPNFEMIYQQMRIICSKVMQAQKKTAPEFMQPAAQAAFELFGFDFILDAQLRLWLLEVNQAPCFPKEESHHLKEHLYNQLFYDVVVQFVIPIAKAEAFAPKSLKFDQLSL